MKFLTKLLFLIAFITPYSVVNADTHDDATMDVIEHSDADHYENEIELPELENDDDHGKEHADSIDSEDSLDSNDGKDEVDEVDEQNEVEDSKDEKEDVEDSTEDDSSNSTTD